MGTKELADLRAAVSDAAREAVTGEPAEDATAEAEGTEVEDATPAASTGGSEADDSSEGSADSEGAVATDATDVPTEYFGIEFPPDLTPEQRAGLISELKKRDDTIGKLLREKGESPDEAASQEDAEPPQELTDEDILRALNLDPNDPFDEATGKVAVPLVRKQMQQEATLAQLIEIQELAEIDRTWRSSLEGLEKEFGSLPKDVDHERVMEFAADNGIHSPLDAYWRIMGPGRAEVEKAVKALPRPDRSADKAAAATTRPASSSADDDAPIKATTTKEATREVATRLLKDLGLV